MRRFRFALERVRGLRQHQERAARLVMAQAVANLSALELRHQQLEANLETCGAQGHGDHMAVLARALEDGLTRARRRLAQDIEAATQRVERATETYRERRRDLLTLDKLRDKALETHKRESQAEEQKEFDEMAQLRFAVGMGESR